MNYLRKTLLCTLTALMLGTPVSAHAGGLADILADEDSDPESVAKARFTEGKVLLETSAYLDSLEAFREAYAAAQSIEDEERRDWVLQSLRYYLADAHFRSYGVDGQKAHLATSRDLLERVLNTYPEEEDATALLANVTKALAKHTDEAEMAEETASVFLLPDAKPKAVSRPPRASEPGSAAPVAEPPELDQPRNAHLAWGIAATTVGAIGLGVMGAGIGIGNAAERDYLTASTSEQGALDVQGRAGNTLAIAGGVAGGLSLVTGAVLIGVGVKKKRASRLSLAPAGFGARVSWRF
jgi:tetratricopeptide (TPR) repeat protein